MKRLAYILLLAGLLACLLPAYGVVWSTTFAERHGCAVHEGFETPCIVDGVDYGDRLYRAFVMGWLLFVTLPVAVAILVALAVMALVDVLRWRRRRRDRA